MKLIEAMKRVKSNKEKITDLQGKVGMFCANLNYETLQYGSAAETAAMISEWLQPCTDLTVWRRREYAALDLKTWQMLTDRGLREGSGTNSSGTPIEVKIVRHFDPVRRDNMVAMFKSEPYEIDSALEVTNAVTDLLD